MNKELVLNKLLEIEGLISQIRNDISDDELNSALVDSNITAKSICYFLNHDCDYLDIERKVLKILERNVDTTYKADSFIYGYIKALADINIITISQLREYIISNRNYAINHAIKVSRTKRRGDSVIYGIALHYLLFNAKPLKTN